MALVPLNSRRFGLTKIGRIALTFTRFGKIPMLVAMFALSASGHAAGLPDGLEAFREQRGSYAAQFARQVSACIVRKDTSHPAFHGCVDWHSAAHAAWALSAYARITGDTQYDTIVETILSDGNLRLEQQYLLGHPDFEMPYGRSWFLRLAVERDRAGKSALMDTMARQVAHSLVDFLRHRPIAIDTRDYDNLSWALVNLWEYAAHYNDSAVREFVSDAVRKNYLSDRDRCAFDSHEGFMAICTTAAWAVAETVAKQEFDEWIARFLPPSLPIQPISQPATSHRFGLNFSRAWGFWVLYRKTNDPRYLNRYLAHFNVNATNKDWWAGDYMRVGHWVAQFGMLAITLSFDDWPG